MRISLPVLFATFAVAIAACSDSTPTQTETQGSSMKATINGSAWTASVAAATKVQTATTILGTALDGSRIQLVLSNVTATGDYSLGLQHVAIYTNATDTYTTQYSSGSAGTAKVTTLDATHIAGSFSFTAETVPGSGSTKTVTVTSGTFNAKF